MWPKFVSHQSEHIFLSSGHMHFIVFVTCMLLYLSHVFYCICHMYFIVFVVSSIS